MAVTYGQKGYVGQSMSVRAKQAYEEGEMPLSKWNKQAIINAMEDNDYSQEIIEKAKAIPLQDLKENCLYCSSWHHTGKYAQATDFYSLEDEEEVSDYILSYDKQQAKEQKRQQEIKKEEYRKQEEEYYKKEAEQYERQLLIRKQQREQEKEKALNNIYNYINKYNGKELYDKIRELKNNAFYYEIIKENKLFKSISKKGINAYYIGGKFAIAQKGNEWLSYEDLQEIADFPLTTDSRKGDSKMKKTKKRDGKNPLGSLRGKIIEFPNNDIVGIDYDEENNILFAGGITNAGIMHEVETQYDEDLSLAENIEILVEMLVSENPDRMSDSKKKCDSIKRKTKKRDGVNRSRVYGFENKEKLNAFLRLASKYGAQVDFKEKDFGNYQVEVVADTDSDFWDVIDKKIINMQMLGKISKDSNDGLISNFMNHRMVKSSIDNRVVEILMEEENINEEEARKRVRKMTPKQKKDICQEQVMNWHIAYAGDSKRKVSKCDSYKSFLNSIGRDHIQYFTHKNRFNYDIKQVRIDNDNKTYQIGIFTYATKRESTQNGKEFDKVIEFLENKGYTKVANNRDSKRDSIDDLIELFYKVGNVAGFGDNLKIVTAQELTNNSDYSFETDVYDNNRNYIGSAENQKNIKPFKYFLIDDGSFEIIGFKNEKEVENYLQEDIGTELRSYYGNDKTANYIVDLINKKDYAQALKEIEKLRGKPNLWFR